MYFLKLKIEKDTPRGRLSIYQHEVELDAELVPQARETLVPGADDTVQIERARYTLAAIVGSMIKSALLEWVAEDDG